ncbi:hypothetical protein IWQ56_003416 [Coemansia nantahalensis]|nr:hypothetical protein IWQ56_003416 [Coemansia nantahalensis]
MSSASSADPGTPGSEGTAGVPSAEGQEALGLVEHGGRVYHVGDHVVLDDPEGTSGTAGTELAAVGHIHGLQRAVGSGAVSVSVVWYVYPQLTPHPGYVEFHRDELLRTFRQTIVPVERIAGICYVVSSADAKTGRPEEWKDGERIFVCDSRFVDRGAYIQKLKGRARGYWPETMDEARCEMLTTMVKWPDGPRALDRAPVEMLAGDDDASKTPQTRRTTRLTTAPNTVAGQESAAPAPSTPTPAPAAVHAQLLAYQQILAQGQLPSTMSSPVQAPQPLSFVPPGSATGQVPLSPFQSHQQQAIGAHFSPGGMQMAGLPYPQASSPMSPMGSFPPGLAPKRRGRPPKNKQLIERRAMEDAAAAMAAAAAAAAQHPGQMPMSPTSALPRHTPGMFPSVGRPPPAAPLSASSISSHNSAQQQQLALLQQSQGIRPPGHPQPATAASPAVAPIPYDSGAPGQQLPAAVVDLFPTVNGNIRWFAAAPIRLSATDSVCHSRAYLDWRQQQHHNRPCDV